MFIEAVKHPGEGKEEKSRGKSWIDRRRMAGWGVGDGKREDQDREAKILADETRKRDYCEGEEH